MMDKFTWFDLVAKQELITYLTDELPGIFFTDSSFNYNESGKEFKLCILRLNSWIDPQHVALKGTLGVELIYGNMGSIEEDSGKIRNLILYHNDSHASGEMVQKIFTTKEYEGVVYQFWFTFANSYDMRYYPEYREFQKLQGFDFRAKTHTIGS